MTRHSNTVFFLVPALLALSTRACADEDLIPRAERLIKHSASLAWNFDAAVADLYADSALIQHRRISADGRSRLVEMPAGVYKALMKAAMPFAKSRGDRNRLSDVKYSLEKGRVRVVAKRYSELKKYSSPISWLVGPAEGGNWLIFEEQSETRR
jgi:hypothetical protein